ncbi:hypothetical protein BKA70DRAFT_1291645 [Coprinopsis sp. MPI-PUGE-AT-0042]|nr:hypothetical protein BKA70DRAFT_1291645 [Coprinopsis sp. MPI-PUGE-AT-0042]
MAATTTGLSASIQALVPSENWDDDFEFQQQPSSSTSPPRKTTTRQPRQKNEFTTPTPISARLSVASSQLTEEDWDAESVTGAGLAAGPSNVSFGSPTRSSPRSGKKRSAASKPSVAPGLAQWAEEDDDDQDQDLMSPSRRLFPNASKTENWDDDFEDRVESPPRASTSRKEAEESWDEEFGLGPPPRRRQTPRKTKNAPQRQRKPSNGSVSSDDDAEFGFLDNEKEEDKTVTARSRRSALPRPSPPPSPIAPPPVPTFLSSSPRIPVFPNSSPSLPAPRSPTSSVFSVPTTIGGADTRSFTSTTYLRATSRSSSGHGHVSLSQLPPSPPIHKARERRRLRKKSRPAPTNAGIYEMTNMAGRRNYPYAYAYAFSDGELEEIRDVDEDALYNPPRTPSPQPPPIATQPLAIPVTPARSTSVNPPPGSSVPEGAAPSSYASNSSVPVPPTPSSSRAGALLSRLGSVTKKGWSRTKRGASISAADNSAPTTSNTSPSQPSVPAQTPQKRHLEYEEQQVQQLTPRPRSSMSSLHHSGSRSSSRGHRPAQSSLDLRPPPLPAPQAASGGAHPPPSSGGWFFRSTSNTSGGGRSSLGGYAGGHSRNGSLSDLSVHEEQRDLETPGPENANQPSSSKQPFLGPLTPSKLIKRKSLGFVQLRRGFGGHNSGENEVVNAFDSGDSSLALPQTPQKPGKRPMSMAVGGEGKMKGGGQPRHASYGAPSTPQRERKKSALGGRARSGSKSSTNQPPTDAPETDDTDPDQQEPLTRSAEKGKDKAPAASSSSSLASGVRAFMGNVRRLSMVGSSKSPGAEGTKGKGGSTTPGGGPGKHKRTKSGGLAASVTPVKHLMETVSLKGIHGSRSRSGTPNSQHARPLTPSTSYPHLSSAMTRRESQSSALAKREAQRRRSGSRTESRAESRSESRSESRTERSRPGSRNGGLSPVGGSVGPRAFSPISPSAMGSRQVSSGSNVSAGTGSVSSVPMPPPPPIAATIPSGRRRSGSASSSATSSRASSSRPSSRSSHRETRDRGLSTSTVMAADEDDNQKTPRASKIQYYAPRASEEKPPPVPLLPPIELHPPSPPRLPATQAEEAAGRYQSLGDAASDSLSPSGLSPSLPSPAFSPPHTATSSSTGRTLSPIMSVASLNGSPRTIQEPTSTVFTPSPGSVFSRPSVDGPTLRPSTSGESHTSRPSLGEAFTGSDPLNSATRALRAPASPGQLQSASLGRSAVSSVVAGNGSSVPSASGSGSSSATGTTSGAAGAGVNVPRRNSLGDLKIPARISQAQSSLRRDLGMVREFAGHVEHMKTLQTTYDTLVGEVQALLNQHAAAGLHHQHQQQAAETPPRTHSPNFFNNLVGNARAGGKFKLRRRSYTNPEGGTGPSSSEVSLQSTLASPPPFVTPAQSAEAKAAYKDLVTGFWTINSKYQISWECADLLVELGSGSGGGTNADASPSKQVIAGIGQSISGASASTTAIVSPSEELKMRKNRERAITLAGDESRPSTPSLPSNLQPGLQHRAHSQPQHSTPSQPTDPPAASPPSWRASTGRHDLSQRQLSLLKEMLNNPASSAPSGETSALPEEPASALPSSTLSPLSNLPSASSLNVNRDWRWGNDPMSSTVTLPSEEESQAHGDQQPPSNGGTGKKRRLTMSGFRDMLRALRKGGGVIDTSSSEVESSVYAQRDQVAGSMASLTIDDSTDGHNTQRRTGTQKRPKSSAGGLERTRGQSGRSTVELSDSSYGPSQVYHPGKLAPKSPRRPSLASIFKIGIGGKSKPGSMNGSLPTVGAGTGTPPGSAPESAASSRVPSGTSTSDEAARRFGDPGDDGGTEPEEDWDQIDSASDLEGHEVQPMSGKSYGSLSSPLGQGDPSTIRAPSTSRKRLKKPHSPYLQQDPYASRSTSGLSVTKKSASSSQVSLYISSDSSSAHAASSPPSEANAQGNSGGPSMTTPRPFRLSKVQESHAESPVFPSRKLPPFHTSPGASNRPTAQRSVSGSSKFNTMGSAALKTGSTRSILPQPIIVPSHGTSSSLTQGQGPPILALTPENIKPLLENAREVQSRLNHCIAEVQALLARARATPVVSTAPAPS